MNSSRPRSSVLMVLAAALLTGCSAGATGAGTDARPAAPHPAADAVYLDTLDSLADPLDTIGRTDINGEPYPHAIGAQFCGADQRAWEYDLGRDYRTFRATIGLRDDSASDSRVRYAVFADGRKLFEQEMAFGADMAVNVPVDGALRLRLVSTVLAGASPCGHVAAQWGEAALEPGPR